MSSIPKTIHYIWFGGKPKSANMMAVIDTWRTLMPGYEVREWNESNIDVTGHPWMKRMYEEGRYAFASDYARFQILWEHGGVYLDTDMAMKKSIEPLLNERCLWSFELDAFLATCIIASVPQHPLIRALMAEYDGLREAVVNNAIVTAYFLRTYPDFELNNQDQRIGEDIRVLPKEYFVVPSFDRNENFAVHNSRNPWRLGRRKLRFGQMLRPLLGEVLFFKLINVHMNLTSEFPVMARARRRLIST